MQKRRILLVEDEVTLSDTIKEILDFNNFDIKTALNGENALIILKDWQPDLIISDVMMPGISGFDLIKIVKKIPETSQIPFMFLSAMVAHQEQKKGLDLGAKAFLSKPFKTIELLKLIEKLITK
jgi:DNA-binding response OmpR family regulator